MMRWLVESLYDYFGIGIQEIKETQIHLSKSMEWLCRAQDVGHDNGVSRMYHLKTGWGSSYPETTGYIIPTFINYYHITGEKEYLDRALRMTDWESDVQMPDGAVQGGTIADKPSPAIFNTGQVLFGWVSAYKETKNTTYFQSLSKASDYLCRNQDDDGAWRKSLSEFCSAPVDSYAYNVRSAWALWLASEVTGNSDYKKHAEDNLNYVIHITHENGWTEKNCLNDPDAPLLHTIAYTFQGMMELAVLSKNEAALQLVIDGNQNLLKHFLEKNELKGRYNQRWNPTVNWRCLTGEAQTSIVWFRLAEITGNEYWREAAVLLLNKIKPLQRIKGIDGMRGGIKGSYPVYGWYGKYEYLNWATKFYSDALMLELSKSTASHSG